MVINFGTDGWRAIIADQFTFENVAICTNATLDYLKQNGLNNKGIAIGYDTRFHSDKFAKLVATLASNSNFKTFLFDRPSPTPVLAARDLNVNPRCTERDFQIFLYKFLRLPFLLNNQLN